MSKKILSDLKTSPNSPIALFDSGVGGLTVLKEVLKILPNENVLYFADTLRVPYGSRTPDEIVKFNYEILNFFNQLNVKMVIMACGTSSSIAFPIVKDKYKFPIISLIEPVAQFAVSSSKNKKIGIIATQTTVNSGAYERAIKKLDKNIKTFSVACPLFVPLVEGGFIEAEETKNTANGYLKPLLKENIDTLILGCTHYPHLLKVLREITGTKIKFINPADSVVLYAKKVLTENNLLGSKSSVGKCTYYVSGSTAQFTDIGSKLLGTKVEDVKKVLIQKTGKIIIEG